MLIIKGIEHTLKRADTSREVSALIIRLQKVAE